MRKSYRLYSKERPSLMLKWAFLQLLLAAPSLAWGQNAKSLYMSVVFNSTNRSPIEVELPTVKSGQRGPVIDFAAGRVHIDGRTVSLTSVKGLSFEAKVPTGIEAPATATPAPKSVFALDGRLVRRDAQNLDGLKKGIYIVNGKKLIIK